MATMHKQPPMLLCSGIYESYRNPSQWKKLYSFTEGRIYRLRFQDILFSPIRSFCYCSFASSRYLGSSYGWLISADSDSVELFNPFTKKPIYVTIPRQPSLSCFIKVALSCNPTTCPDDFVVGMICRKDGKKTVAFRRTGQDSNWTFMNILDFDCFEDIIFYKGLLYVFVGFKRLIAIDYKNVVNGDQSVTRFVEIVPESSTVGRTYIPPRARGSQLVESSNGELLLVRKFMKSASNGLDSTPDFIVYKLAMDEEEEEKLNWLKISELEKKDTIFFSYALDHHFVWISPVPNSSNPSSICVSRTHYRDDNRISRVGVFNMKDETFKYLPCGEVCAVNWVTPTLG